MDRIEALREIVAADPDDGLSRFMLGQELLKAGCAGEAVEHLEAAIRLTPDRTAAYRHLGVALEKAGRVAEARDVFRRGLDVAEETRDLQTAKEIQVFLKRLETGLANEGHEK